MLCFKLAEVTLAKGVQFICRSTLDTISPRQGSGFEGSLVHRHIWNPFVRDEPPGPYLEPSVQRRRREKCHGKRERERSKSLHLLNSWTQTTTSRRQGCDGTAISCSWSLAVGIQKLSRPPSTSVAAEKSRMSSSMARKLYGLLGCM